MDDDDLSLLKDSSDDDNEEEKDDIIIQFGANSIHVKYSQLCKYSQLIRVEYLISDVKNRLPRELQQYQQENAISDININNFFHLFQEKKITMSNDKYKDFLKLSQFFKVKKLQNQLKKYFKSHVTDIDFVIRLFLDEIESKKRVRRCRLHLYKSNEAIID